MSTKTNRRQRLNAVYRTVLDTVEALNAVHGRPVSAVDVCEAMMRSERLAMASNAKALPARVARVLNQLSNDAKITKVKNGRVPLFYVPGKVQADACREAAKPSRRRRVLELVYVTVEQLQRAARAGDIVAVAEARGLTREIPADMVKRDLTNLVRTGELRVVSTVRGDGNGSNLYLPADLDPAAFADNKPLTWLEELHQAFEAVWVERARVASLSDQKPVPPSTGEVRAQFRALYPGHEKLSDPQLLVNGMRQLAESSDRLVRPVRRTGQRALLWAPVGVTDDDLDLGAAHASDVERAVEAARRAMAALRVPAVRVEEVQDEIDRDNRLAPAGKQPLRVVLSDAARTELANSDGTRSPRAQQHLVRVGLAGGSTYYSAPGAAGAAEYLELLRLRAEWPDLNGKEELDAVRKVALPSIRVGRALHLAQETESIAVRARGASKELPYASFVEEVGVIHEEAAACAAEARALAAEVTNVRLPQSVTLPTGGYTPAELLAIISPRYPLASEDLTPARLVPLLDRQIRRIPNPAFEWRFSRDVNAATEYLFEPVSALIYAAFRWGDEDERYYANLVATTLGKLRDPRFVAPLLESSRFEERMIGVACLAFLGDPDNQLSEVVGKDVVAAVREAAEWGINFANSTRRTCV